MEEKKNKCPLCNKKLVMKEGVPTCPDCGYRDPYRSGSSQPQGNYGQSTGGYQQSNYNQPGGYQQSNYNQPGGYQQSNYNQPGGYQQSNYNQPGGYQQSNYNQSGSGPQPNHNQSGSTPQGNYSQPGSGYQRSADRQSVPPNNSRPQPNYGQTGQNQNQPPKKGNSMTVAIIAVITVTAVFTIISVLVGLIHSAVSMGDRGEGGGNRDSAVASSAPAADAQESSIVPYTQSGGGSVLHLSFHPPESELLQEFVSQLFDKPASSVTREDLNSVVSVTIRDMDHYSGTEISYELSDGTAETCYLSSTRVDSEDFKCFPNIQALDLGRESLDWETNWYGLTSLTSLTCEASLEELEGFMDVSQLTALSLTCDFMMGDCSGLDAYSSLEYLKLDCDGHSMGLAGISQAVSLRSLVIEDGDFIKDFGELYGMTQLRELSIESDGLRDIGFIRDMPGLESLELVSTGLLQVDAIRDRADTLKCLRLHQNYSVEDYSAVFECTGLEELELYVDYDFDKEMVMPDLSMMPGLKVLTLGNYEKFPGLGGLTALESLTLTDGGSFGDDGKLTGLENLVNLKSLALIDMSMEPELLRTFASVPSLEKLDLTDSFIWGDINTVFEMPCLTELIMEDVNFGLRLDGMPVSESLQALDMRDARAHQLREDGAWDYGASNTQIELGEYTEFFGHMPNLTTLKVPGQELQDVKFAEGMTQLTYLDITDNYVTDLSPLAGLGQLKVLVCGNNPVHDRTGLKDLIIME